MFENIMSFMENINSALIYAHLQEFYSRDILPKNIIVNNNRTILMLKQSPKEKYSRCC
jgi:hypothetical protein